MAHVGKCLPQPRSPRILIGQDFSRDEAERMLQILYGRSAAASIMRSRWQIVK